MRFRFIETLARRTAEHGDEPRRLLDVRLAQLLAAYAADVQRNACVDDTAGRAAQAPHGASPRRPLAALLDRIADGEAMVNGKGSPIPARQELKAMRHFRSTWERLIAHQRLADSLAKAPRNAGPLNSQHLVHRSLSVMCDVSPEYLSRFVSYVDTLLWLDRATGGSLPMTPDTAAPANRPTTGSAQTSGASRKSSRSRPHLIRGR